jgi:hypothetical protein
MIYIDKNETNLVALTLRENSPIISDTFLFLFQNDWTKEETILNKTSIVNNVRYTGFQFIDGVGGEMDLRPGQYTYRVLILPNGSTSSNPNDGVAELEEGRMYVIGEWLSVDPVYQ